MKWNHPNPDRFLAERNLASMVAVDTRTRRPCDRHVRRAGAQWCTAWIGLSLLPRRPHAAARRGRRLRGRIHRREDLRCGERRRSARQPGGRLRRQLIRSDYRAGCPIVAVTVEGRGSRSPRTHHEADRTRRGSIRALDRPGPPTTGGRRCGNAARRGTGDAGDGIHRGRDRRRPSIVLQNTQARAELPAGSRRTIAASRIQLHRAGAVALQAVEHTDPMQSSAGQSAVALRGTHMVASRS